MDKSFYTTRKGKRLKQTRSKRSFYRRLRKSKQAQIEESKLMEDSKKEDEAEELLYDAEMKPIIEDRLKNGKHIRVSLDELNGLRSNENKPNSKRSVTLHELLTDQVEDENLKKEAWAQLNQMLKEADESPDSDLDMDDVLKLTLARIKERRIEAHKHSINHREEILNSSLCGCFYCLKIFQPSKIVEWADSGKCAI